MSKRAIVGFTLKVLPSTPSGGWFTELRYRTSQGWMLARLPYPCNLEEAQRWLESLPA